MNGSRRDGLCFRPLDKSPQTILTCTRRSLDDGYVAVSMLTLRLFKLRRADSYGFYNDLPARYKKLLDKLVTHEK